MAKFELKKRAISLRKNGESIKAIARILEISSSTASVWCRDIELTKYQMEELEMRSRDPFYGKRLEYQQKISREVENKKSQMSKKGAEMVGRMLKRDVFIAGAALYWAEGFKKDKMVGFANTDPEMIKLALVWFEKSLGIPRSMIRLRVVINESHRYRVEEIQKYWMDITNISRAQFYQPTFQKVIWRKTYSNPEKYFGVLRIRVLKSTDLLRKIKGMILGLSDLIV